MMWDLIRDALGWALLGGGAFFVVVGGIGMLRFPDFYARLHAGGVTDTLGAELMLLGMMVQSDDWMVIAKLVIIGLFLFMTSPVASHAIAHAAYVAGLKPVEGSHKDRQAKAEKIAEGGGA